MPYFITDESPECSGWATIKEDGEVIGCHDTKQAAIDQMVAVSIAEGMEPGGERLKMKKPKGYMRALPDNYRPSLSPDVPDGRACGNCYFYDESDVQGERAWCEKWNAYVHGHFYCNAWQPDVEESRQTGASTPAPKEDQITGSEQNEPGSASGAGGDIEVSESTRTALQNKVSEHNEEMERQDKPSWTRTTLGQLLAVYRRGAGAYSQSHRPGVTRGAWAMARVNAFLYLLRNGNPENPNYITDFDLLPQAHPKSTRQLSAEDLSPPQYIRDAASKGLEYYAEGLAGDGLVAATVREARAMARGEVTEDKIIRANAWGARHAPDLDAPRNSNADDEGFPGAGAVAHYLWGIDPLNPMPARNWFERKADQIKAERVANPAFIANMFRQELGESMTPKIEQREVALADIEMRKTDEDSDFMSFRGYAAVFNSMSEDMGFREIIRPGAFTKSLKSRNAIRMFLNHNSDIVLASSRAKTLRLQEDERGLLVDADLPDTSAGRDLSVLMRRGDVDSMSFGFSVPKGGDSWSDDGMTRTLNQVRLHEVSVVTGFPAYKDTVAQVRSFDVLAERTNTNADELAEAITLLENGKELDDAKADLLSEVVTKLRATPAEVVNSLDVKRKHLELLAKTL